MFKAFLKTGIQAHYSVSSNPSFSSDSWSVFPAKHRSSGKKVSVFIFDKKSFESRLVAANGAKNAKQMIEEAYVILKAQVVNLAKFKHPNILTIMENLEEHKANFMFVTEYLTASLSTCGKLDDVIIQKGLLQLGKGLEFFHSTCNIIHLNIQPNSVFINENSDWKLGGLGFIKNLNEMTSNEIGNFYLNTYDSRIPGFMNLSLDFTAPEVVLDNNLGINNDIFSLGCLIYHLYNGESFLKCENSTTYYKQEFKKFETRFNQSNTGANKKLFYKEIPDVLYSIYPTLVARHPYDRTSIQDFLTSNYFNNPLIKTMIFIDEFPTKSEEEKLIFLKGLINLLPLFPNTLLQQKFLPLLIDIVGNKSEASLIPISLTIILIIGKTLSNLTFHDKINPILLNLIDIPEAQLIMIDNLEILNKKLNGKDLVLLLKPLVNLILQPTSNPQLQEKFFGKFELIIDVFDFPYIKNDLFPAICNVFSKTTSMATKVATINTFQLMATKKTIDKFIIEESLLPLLQKLKTREPIVLLSLLSFYDKTCQVLEVTTIVEEIIPQLWKLSISSTLSIENYKRYMVIIKAIQDKIESKQLLLLTNLNNDNGIKADKSANENFTNLLYNNSTTSSDSTPREAPIQPTRKQSIGRPTRQPVQPIPIQAVVPPTMEPKRPTAAPLSLQPQRANKLSFGSTSNAPKPVINLINRPVVNNDDDFGDFESYDKRLTPDVISNQPTGGANNAAGTGQINWSSEVHKPVVASSTYTMNSMSLNNVNNNGGHLANNNGSFNTTPSFGGINNNSGFTAFNAPAAAPATPNVNYPPGFGIQLTPNSNAPRVMSSTTNSNPKNSNDLLDFL